ncbi:MAG: SH3 domain-containing protein [Chloroflexota bacterium]
MKRLYTPLLVLVLLGATLVPGNVTPVSAHGAQAWPGPSAVDQTWTYARVVKRYGAAIRAAPSSDSTIYWMASCNDIYAVIGQTAGWYEVRDRDGTSGWIGGARVSVGGNPPPVDCRGAVTFQPGTVVYASVQSGCLSIRHQPSRTASYGACVPNGYPLDLMNGPVEVAGEDWFAVWSTSTGGGWSLAAYLRPSH